MKSYLKSKNFIQHPEIKNFGICITKSLLWHMCTLMTYSIKLIFKKNVSLLSTKISIHPHLHTHAYIYIYIQIRRYTKHTLKVVMWFIQNNSHELCELFHNNYFIIIHIWIMWTISKEDTYVYQLIENKTPLTI